MSGYFPIIACSSDWDSFKVIAQDNRATTMGELHWDSEWGCYVFIPEDIDLHMGPAFLAMLSAEMIRLEAKRRKEWMTTGKLATNASTITGMN